MQFFIAATGVLALIMLTLWRRSFLLRVAVAAVAVLIFVTATPSPYRALRRAADLPDSARASENLWTHRPATPFESGVFTMYHEMQQDSEHGAGYRVLAVVSLTVLAVLPMRSRPGGNSRVPRTDDVVSTTSTPGADKRRRRRVASNASSDPDRCEPG